MHQTVRQYLIPLCLIKACLIKKYFTVLMTALLLLGGGTALAAGKAMPDSPPKAGSEMGIPQVEEKKAEITGEQKISINSATAQELTALSGIGMKKAQAIIEYREKYGAFTEVEQLQEVPGIGPALLAKNLERLKL